MKNKRLSNSKHLGFHTNAIPGPGLELQTRCAKSAGGVREGNGARSQSSVVPTPRGLFGECFTSLARSLWALLFPGAAQKEKRREEDQNCPYHSCRLSEPKGVRSGSAGTWACASCVGHPIFLLLSIPRTADDACWLSEIVGGFQRYFGFCFTQLQKVPRDLWSETNLWMLQRYTSYYTEYMSMRCIIENTKIYWVQHK